MLILDKTVLVGNSQNPQVGSNEAGFRWLKNYLGEDYEVVRVPLREDVLHLDCALSIPRDGLAIICKDALIEGVPEPIKEWDLIGMELRDLTYLALNGLPIDSTTYIMGFNDSNSNERLKRELTKRGINVHPIYFAAHNSQGGSLRCATQALVRQD